MNLNPEFVCIDIAPGFMDCKVNKSDPNSDSKCIRLFQNGELCIQEHKDYPLVQANVKSRCEGFLPGSYSYCVDRSVRLNKTLTDRPNEETHSNRCLKKDLRKWFAPALVFCILCIIG